MVVAVVVFAVVLRVVGFQMHFSLWHRVVSMSSPWVTAENSSGRQVESFEWSVLFECLKCILRACRSEPAARLLERRDADLIESDQNDEGEYSRLFKKFFHLPSG